MEDLDVIKTINEKIKKEEQMRQAAVRLKSNSDNPAVRTQCEQSIMVMQRNIDYLRNELEKVQLKHQNLSTSGNPPYQNQGQNMSVQSHRGVDPNAMPGNNESNLRKPVLSNLDLIKSDTPMTTQKVSLKLHELEFKLDVERKLMEGSQKMANAVVFQDPKNKKSIAEVAGKMIESKEKISLLSRSLNNYKKLYITGINDEDETSNDDNDMYRLTPGLRRRMTGKLDIRIYQVRHVQHAHSRTSKTPETTAVIKIDGQPQARTKVTRNGRWNENFTLHVEKASEIEITVYDKPNEHQVPIGLLWIKINDIAEEMRKKKKFEAGSGPGWVTASDGGFESQNPPTFNNNNPYTDLYSIPYPSTQSQQGTATTISPDGIEAWFELEPVGQILLKLDFTKENVAKRPAAIGRVNAKRIPKKIFEQNGHKFVQRQFYPIMKCAYCEELFLNDGYQCDDCKLTCHKKCHTKIVTKCISKSNSEMDSDYKQLNHRIPHRFEAVRNMSAGWCCHCGYMLPLGRKAMKCTECSIACHSKCSHLVPYFCGLPMKTANNMIEQIRQANANREERRPSFADSQASSPVISQAPNQQATPIPYYPPPSYPPPDDGQLQEKHNQGKAQYSPAGEYPEEKTATVEYSEPITQKPPLQQVQRVPVVPKPVQKPPKIGLENFDFLAVLGKGNFGKVMLAEERATKLLYAIKVLKKEYIIENDEVESTRSEKRVFQAANRERHPFLVGLHSCFQTETRIYFVMEYVSGGDLMLHIQREQFTYRRAQFYAAEVLLALEYFHKQGIIYRDLKLDNILLALDGHIKIADYGLCKEEMWFGNTTNTFCGTPEFMAPEILLEKRYGRAVDWWAFGVLIYEMLLGQSPFRGDDEDEIFDAILEDEILYPINMSRDSVSILQRLLTRDPERRLGSGKGDAEEIKRHPFFKGVNWDDMLAKKVPPPYYPTISSRTDTSNFDKEFTSEIPTLTPINSRLGANSQEEFREFSYVADWVLNGESLQ